MAEATLTRTEVHSAGDLTLHIFTFSSIADTNTHTTGLTNIVAWHAQLEANEGTAGDEGVNVAESSAQFTFFLKTSGAGKLFVYSANV